MVFNLFPNLKRYDEGITLIEIIVVIFIVAIFSLILIVDFPEIQKRYALSGVTYKLAQDFRKTQDLGLSAVQLKDVNGSAITTVKGYGIYIDLSQSETQYIIYADVADVVDVNGSQSFNNDTPISCADYDSAPPQSDTGDCIIETIDVNESNQGMFIKGIDNITAVNKTSVNFSPPSPVINIENLNTNLQPPDNSRVGIVLGLKSESASRTVWVNTSGLINIQ